MDIKLRQRLVILGLVLLLHVGVFCASRNFIIFNNPESSTQEKSDGFLKIALPSKAVQPPPPPDMPSLPAMSGGSSSASIAMPIVASTPMPTFTIPMPSVNAPALNQHIEDSLRASGISGHGIGGTGTGSGDGTGTGSSEGTSAGNMADICGLRIATTENVVVIEDVWQAWHSTGTTSTKVQRYAEDCISKFFFGTTPVQVNGDLTFYNPHNTRVNSIGDLYKAAYALEDTAPDGKAPTVMLFISTWVNVGETANLLPQDETLREDATKAFVDSLRAHHIKLYLLSTKLPPFHGLTDYAKESGGQVSVTPELDLNNTK